MGVLRGAHLGRGHMNFTCHKFMFLKVEIIKKRGFELTDKWKILHSQTTPVVLLSSKWDIQL